MPASFPITSSAADAISSATATIVVWRTWPTGSVTTAEIEQRRDPGAAQRHVDDPVPEGPAERVADHHAELTAGALHETRTDPRGRRIGIDREEHERAILRRVRRVDSRRRADEAVPRLRDHERRPRPDDLGCLGEDHLQAASIFSGCELACALRRLDAVEPNHAALRLRDHLLRDDDDVAVLERHALGDQRGEIVSLDDLGDALDGYHAELRHRQGRSRRARDEPPRRASASR